MSTTLSLYITFIVLLNIFGCVWLIRWTSKKSADEAAEGDVTGHTWDGLEEFNNPLPRWWLWLFYITIVFALGYLALFPGLGSIWKGQLGWTGVSQYEKEMEAADNKYGPLFAQYASTDLDALLNEPKALKMGQRIFLNYCAVCHGSDARGATGFPNLADDDWLYGGTPDAIKVSIAQGRRGVMPGWQAVLQDDGVEAMAHYVVSLSGRDHDAALASKGAEQYKTLCIACHGAEGKGNLALGAPNLTDKVWLYGGSMGAIKKTLSEGRNGHMPAQLDFLGSDKVHLVAAYIYSLSKK
jgi:cytochrome c oxidase cbb3-type subunit 3